MFFQPLAAEVEAARIIRASRQGAGNSRAPAAMLDEQRGSDRSGS